jgi:hypothetical protein
MANHVLSSVENPKRTKGEKNALYEWYSGLNKKGRAEFWEFLGLNHVPRATFFYDTGAKEPYLDIPDARREVYEFYFQRKFEVVPPPPVQIKLPEWWDVRAFRGYAVERQSA